MSKRNLQSLSRQPSKATTPQFSWKSVRSLSAENFDLLRCVSADELPSSLFRRPKPYRKLDVTGNSWRGIPKPQLREKDDEEWPACECEPGAGCGDDCMNRTLFMECRLGSCQGGHGLEGGDCGNTVLQTRRFPVTEVVLTPGCGWGLRCLEEVSPGRPIIEYCGEVITVDTCRQRLSSLERGQDFYFASLDANLVLDAAHMGSNARFANHSCNPNCELQKWVVGREPRVVLCAGDAPIHAGVQATYNYMADTMGGLVKRQKCLCRSSNCCGFIGGRVDVAADKHFTEQAERLLSQAKPRHEALKALIATCDNTANPTSAPSPPLTSKPLSAAERLKSLSSSCVLSSEVRQVLELVAEGDEWIAAYSKALDILESQQTSQTGGRGIDCFDESRSLFPQAATLKPEVVSELLGSAASLRVRIGEVSALRDKAQKAEQLSRHIRLLFPERTVTSLPPPFALEATRPAAPAKSAQTHAIVRSAGGTISTTHTTPCSPQRSSTHAVTFGPGSLGLTVVRDAPAGGAGVLVADVCPHGRAREFGVRAGEVMVELVHANGSSHPSVVTLESYDHFLSVFSSVPRPITITFRPPPAPTTAPDSDHCDDQGGACARADSLQLANSSDGSSAPSSAPSSITLNEAQKTDSSRALSAANRRPSVAQVQKTLEAAARCHPVGVPLLERLSDVEGDVESWAKKACKALQLKMPATSSTCTQRHSNAREGSATMTTNENPRAMTYLDLLTTTLEPIVDLGFQFAEKADSSSAKEPARRESERDQKEGGETGPTSSNEEDAIEAAASVAAEEAAAVATAAVAAALERQKLHSGAANGAMPDLDEESDNDEDSLHCLCRLRESAVGFGNLVKCECCGKWYHLNCVHETARSTKGKAKTFHCPLCLHAAGLPSNLACRPPPAARRPGRLSKVPVSTVKHLVEESQVTLPVTGIVAVSFLACLVDNATAWRRRKDRALVAASSASTPVNDSSSFGRSGATDAGQESSRGGLPQVDFSSSQGSREQERQLKEGGQKRQQQQDLFRGVDSIQRISQLISEGAALQLDVESDLTELRQSLWRVVISTLHTAKLRGSDGLIPELAESRCHVSGSQVTTGTDSVVVGRDAPLWRYWWAGVETNRGVLGTTVEADTLAAYVEGGRALGLEAVSCAELRSLEDTLCRLRSWLKEAEALPFEALHTHALSAVPCTSRPGRGALSESERGCFSDSAHLPFVPNLSLASEPGYRRVLAAMLHEHRRKSLEKSPHETTDERCSSSEGVGVAATQSSSSSEVEAAKAEVVVEEYCLCRGPDDGGLMVECESCNEWFHANCLGTNKTNGFRNLRRGMSTSQVSTEFSCPVCDELKHEHSLATIQDEDAGKVHSSSSSINSSGKKRKMCEEAGSESQAAPHTLARNAQKRPNTAYWHYCQHERSRVSAAVSAELTAAAAAAAAADSAWQLASSLPPRNDREDETPSTGAHSSKCDLESGERGSATTTVSLSDDNDGAVKEAEESLEPAPHLLAGAARRRFVLKETRKRLSHVWASLPDECSDGDKPSKAPWVALARTAHETSGPVCTDPTPQSLSAMNTVSIPPFSSTSSSSRPCSSPLLSSISDAALPSLPMTCPSARASTLISEAHLPRETYGLSFDVSLPLQQQHMAEQIQLPRFCPQRQQDPGNLYPRHVPPQAKFGP